MKRVLCVADSVCDLAGNVWEWVEDDYHSDYTGASTNGSAWVDSPRASVRVIRGGGFSNFDADVLRGAYRYVGYHSIGYYHHGYLGARCCKSQ